jgi:predicted dehydrogenase
MKAIRLAVIGCGNIAHFHIPAMTEVGFKISAIAGTFNSNRVGDFAKKYDIDRVYNDPIELIKNETAWDALLLLSPVSTVIDYLDLAAPFGKPILVEKPVALDHLQLKKLTEYSNIRVAYNRRFYAGVSFAKQFLDVKSNCLVKVTIPERRDDPSHNIRFPNRLPLLSYENSVHMFDLMNFILGNVEWKEVSTIKAADKYIATVALGHASNGATIQLDSYYNAADNFSINIFSDFERIEMKPIEVTRLYSGMEVNEPTELMPIRRYSPKLENEIIDSPVHGHKPGFLGQAQDFMNFCLGKENCLGADIMDAYAALKLAHSLVK